MASVLPSGSQPVLPDPHLEGAAPPRGLAPDGTFREMVEPAVDHSRSEPLHVGPRHGLLERNREAREEGALRCPRDADGPREPEDGAGHHARQALDRRGGARRTRDGPTILHFDRRGAKERKTGLADVASVRGLERLVARRAARHRLAALEDLDVDRVERRRRRKAGALDRDAPRPGWSPRGAYLNARVEPPEEDGLGGRSSGLRLGPEQGPAEEVRGESDR